MAQKIVGTGLGFADHQQAQRWVTYDARFPLDDLDEAEELLVFGRRYIPGIWEITKAVTWQVASYPTGRGRPSLGRLGGK